MKRYRALFEDNARWHGFEFRDDDIIISTPAKCGTTWMQMMCALLVFQRTDLPAPLTELSPWIDIQTDTVDNVFASLARQSHRRFIKSHTPFDGLPRDDRVTYITVGRDPRDAAISWGHHFANLNLDAVFNARAAAVGLDDVEELMGEVPSRPEDPVDRFWWWIEHDSDDSGVTTLRAMMTHLNTFWEQRDAPNVMLFHYSDMQADLEGEMRRLAEGLHIDVDDRVLPELVAAAGFDRMREQARDLAPQVSVDGFWRNPDQFFRSGTSGQWQSFMGPGDEERYESRIAQLAPPDLVAWLQSGWRTP